jgi:hypothetical protein
MSTFDETRLAVTLALPCQKLEHFEHLHVYVWIGARQTATAHVVSANGERVLVAYFPSHWAPSAGSPPDLEARREDARSLGLSEEELLRCVFFLAREEFRRVSMVGSQLVPAAGA